MKLGIGIPTLNRYDLLKTHLLLYSKDFNLPQYKIPFHILDNGRQDIEFEYGVVHNFQSNIGVGASWNFLCDRLFEGGCDNALILNDDIYLGNKLDSIEDLLSKKKNKGQLLRATPDWCAFIISKKVWNEVGRFDECFFPAYYEDKSYEYRMKLKGMMPIKTPVLNPYVYKNSQTGAKDNSILEASKKNKQLYIDMWGGEPEREKFKKPFNEEV
jgi:GT2 family glycosyltransferase